MNIRSDLVCLFAIAIGPIPCRAQMLTGKVVDQAGRPIGGVEVSALVLRGGNYTEGKSSTNNQGQYAIRLNPGDFVESVLYSRAAYKPETIANVTSNSVIQGKVMLPATSSQRYRSFSNAMANLGNLEQVFVHRSFVDGRRMKRDQFIQSMRLRYGPQLMSIPRVRQLDPKTIPPDPRGELRDQYESKRKGVHELYQMNFDELENGSFETTFLTSDGRTPVTTNVVLAGDRGSYLGFLPNGRALVGTLKNVKIEGNENRFTIRADWSQSNGRLTGKLEWAGSINRFKGSRFIPSRNSKQNWAGHLFDEHPD